MIDYWICPFTNTLMDLYHLASSVHAHIQPHGLFPHLLPRIPSRTIDKCMLLACPFDLSYSYSIFALDCCCWTYHIQAYLLSFTSCFTQLFVSSLFFRISLSTSPCGRPMSLALNREVISCIVSILICGSGIEKVCCFPPLCLNHEMLRSSHESRLG